MMQKAQKKVSMDEKKTEVYKSKILTTEQLVEHIKAIGQAIIEDAESVALDTSNVISVSIEAEIVPCEQLTTVKYALERLADPRVKSRKR